jgi:hypothetical protein
MKVKNILIKADLVGNGVVNMDSNEQKFVFNGTNSHLKSFHNNTSYAKKNFYKDGDDLTYKLKISSDCLKNDMFKTEVIAQSPKITHELGILYSYIASPMSLIRGYMFANKQETLKRSGALTICDAEQTCSAVSMMETFSKSGEKTTNDGETDKADNTFYKKETVGNINYSTFGNIDLMKLQFVSADQVFDRYAFNPDNYSLFKSFLGLRLKNFNSELGYYKINNSVLDIPEYGVKLSNENVLDLVKETLTKLSAINIKRKGGFAKVNSLKIKLVLDPLVDTFDSEDNWIELSSLADIDNLSLDIADFYELVEINQAKALRESIEQSLKDEKAKESAAKKEKANAKKTKTDE